MQSDRQQDGFKKLVYLEEISKSYYKLFYENGVYMGTVYMEVDGYYVWLPDNSRGGFLGEGFLFAMAYTLADMNKEWDEIVQKDNKITLDKL